MPTKNNKAKLTYSQAGVEIKAGDEAVERIKKLAAATFNKQVLHGIGAFGGFFKPDLKGFEKPVLVSSADGVGTKLKLAFMTGRHNTVGEDLVNHCVNDILVHGARPLFFMDYIATGKLEPDVVAEIVSGLCRACTTHKMPLLGGETAEMPDFYRVGEYDLAGFIVGVVDEDRIISGSEIVDGDVVLGLPSNGLHTNGYSLARKVVFDTGKLKPDSVVSEIGCTVAEALLQPHRSYYSIIHSLLDDCNIHGMAHITGGGIPGNLKRILPGDLDAEIIAHNWQKPLVFEWLQKLGRIEVDDMFSAFNMGVGYIIVTDEKTAEKISGVNKPVFRIGHIVKGTGRVHLDHTTN